MRAANDDSHRYPEPYALNAIDDPVEDRELLDSLFAHYPDFHDVANALLDRFHGGMISPEFVDAVFTANNWRWPRCA